MGIPLATESPGSAARERGIEELVQLDEEPGRPGGASDENDASDAAELMSAACRAVINLNDYLAPFGAELSRGVARRAMAAMGRLKARSGRVSIMQHARSSYAGLLGSVGRCGTTATAEVTEGAVTFWKNCESRVG